LFGEARDIDRWMYEFIARLAHDVRAPLGAIRMWTHVLRGSDDSGDKQTGLNAIDASVRSHSDLISMLVDMSSAIVGRLALERRRVNPLLSVRAALQMAEAEAKPHGVALEPLQVVPGDGEPSVLGDARRLEQLAAALLSFAVTTTKPGGRVGTRVTTTGDGFELRVSCTEGTVSAAELAGLFTPYQNVGIGQPRRDFGLGLAFARALALSHDGTLEGTHAGPGQGPVFILRLPLAGPPPAG
jgi:signal transduction histidine kinase